MHSRGSCKGQPAPQQVCSWLLCILLLRQAPCNLYNSWPAKIAAAENALPDVCSCHNFDKEGSCVHNGAGLLHCQATADKQDLLVHRRTVTEYQLAEPTDARTMACN